MGKRILLMLFVKAYCDLLDLRHPKTCPDEDLGNKCEGQCEMGYIDCTFSCSDTNCLLECSRALNECVQDCPCNINCPDGCADCPNPICVCGENPSPQNKDNLETCKKGKSIDLGQCIIDCTNDIDCESSCVNLFKLEYSKCPCQSECPFGCPCNSFDCDPDKKSVLVLNTRFSRNVPVLIKYNGGKNENLDFKMGPNTSADHSCSANLNGEMFVFGGDGDHKTQISKIIDCSLERIGELPNEFYNGACGTYKFGSEDERVMFCFPSSDKKKCFSYNGKTYVNHPSTINDHDSIALGDIDNKVLAVGSRGPSNNKVEIFDIETNTWTTKTAFPFCSSGIYRYAAVSRKSSVLIMGGGCDGSSENSLIAKYTLDEWEKVGNLQTDRFAPRAIENGDRIYVVGGVNTQPTEIWAFDDSDNTVNMKIAEPNLYAYDYYPELFVVQSDFCSEN